MDKAIYYLIDLDKEITQEELIKITSIVSGLENVGVNIPEDEQSTAYIFYDKAPFRPKLTITDIPEHLKTNSNQKCIKVETEITDPISAYLLKDVLAKEDFKVYFENIKSYLPQRGNIHDALTITSEVNTKVKKIIKQQGLEPLFLLNNSYVYFARSNSDGSIHLVNDNLLYYFVEVDNKDIKSNEFSYKVADDINDFVKKFDAELIPYLFYEYFNKSLKIMNFSGMDIENPGRKVFIKPYIFEYDNEHSDFVKIAKGDSSVLMMDKIRPGETLDKSIIRIIKEELKIAEDYIGATVSRIIEYDLDRENKLTPRLILKIFIKEAQMTPEQRAKKDRSWVSLDQVKRS